MHQNQVHKSVHVVDIVRREVVSLQIYTKNHFYVKSEILQHMIFYFIQIIRTYSSEY